MNNETLALKLQNVYILLQELTDGETDIERLKYYDDCLDTLNIVTEKLKE